MFKFHTLIVGLVAVLAAIGSASVAEAKTHRYSAELVSEPNPSEAWQRIAQDNLRDLRVTEAWQQIARDNLRDLQADGGVEGDRAGQPSDLRVQERRARRAKKGH